MYFSSVTRQLTYNHLPKNHLIWRVSLRFSEIRRKIILVCRGPRIPSRDRLRAEREVSDFSGGETPHGHRAASLAGPGDFSGLEEFFQRFAAEARDHFRVGYAFDAPEFLEAEETGAVAHERGPVELAHHAAFFGGETGLVERRFGVVLEERAVAGDGETVEETVEPQRLGAGGEVEEVGAFEFFDSFELRVQSRSFASLRMTSMRRCAHSLFSTRALSVSAPRTAPPPSRWSSAGSSSGGFSSRAARARRASRAT